MPSLSVIWNSMLSVIKTFSISDFLDILLVSYLVYKGCLLYTSDVIQERAPEDTPSISNRAEWKLLSFLVLVRFYLIHTVHLCISSIMGSRAQKSVKSTCLP